MNTTCLQHNHEFLDLINFNNLPSELTNVAMELLFNKRLTDYTPSATIIPKTGYLWK